MKAYICCKIKWITTKSLWTELRDIDVFHNIYVSLDQKNVSRRMLHFDQGYPSLGMYSSDIKWINYYIEYTTFV